MILAVVAIILIILIVVLLITSQPCKKEQDKFIAKSVKIPKPNTGATFDRDGEEDLRFMAHASSIKSNFSLPKNFMASTKWPSSISGVFDQERCGSCWAFATSNSFSDRLKIKYRDTVLATDDYISPFNLAACVKCGVNQACPRVCEGNYLDDVCQYIVDHGAMPQSIIENSGDDSLNYHCFDYVAAKIKPVRAKRKYRVNIFPPSALNNKQNLEQNQKAIMQDIYTNGTVCCIIKVYVPNDHRNFYIYDTGIYGHGWASMPSQTEGYHALAIVGWGEEKIGNDLVKYWVVRNSWGDSWGTKGLGRILRGENFGMIECDVWGLEV